MGEVKVLVRKTDLEAAQAALDQGLGDSGS